MFPEMINTNNTLRDCKLVCSAIQIITIFILIMTHSSSVYTVSFLRFIWQFKDLWLKVLNWQIIDRNTIALGIEDEIDIIHYGI